MPKLARLLLQLGVTALLVVPSLGEGTSTVEVPKISSAPRLEDFLDMKPAAALQRLAKVDRFNQQRPKDGEPASQRTEAYLGYDDRNLYVGLCRLLTRSELA